MKYELIEITKSNSKLFKQLYDGSAMTVQGMLMDELDQYLDLMKEKCGLHENCKIYHFVGSTYNLKYGLSTDTGMPKDLNCIAIELNDMDNCMGCRQLIRWFDDIVDNDLRRKKMR